MLKIKIWLDDQLDDPAAPSRHTPAGWVGVKSPKLAIKLIKKGIVSVIDLDHDLGNNALGDGGTVLKYINKRVIQDPEFILPIIRIHSKNVVEANAMLKQLGSIRKSRLQSSKYFCCDCGWLDRGMCFFYGEKVSMARGDKPIKLKECIKNGKYSE